MESNLTSQPSWLEFVPTDNKNTVGVDYGFDSTGMWFSGNAGGCGSISFPIRTNYDISSEQSTTVIYTIQQESCSDQGVCFFVAGTDPSWNFGSCDNRLLVNMDCNNVEVNGLTVSAGGVSLGEGSPYTFRVVYEPSLSKITAEIFNGTSVSDPLLATYVVNERLPAGPYRIGFDADADDSNSGYFTYLYISGEMSINYPLPKITFRVKTYDPVALTGTLPPDGNLENIIKALKEQTVWLPHVDYSLKHDDTFILYGKKAVELKNKISQLNGAWSVVEIISEE